MLAKMFVSIFIAFMILLGVSLSFGKSTKNLQYFHYAQFNRDHGVMDPSLDIYYKGIDQENAKNADNSPTKTELSPSATNSDINLNKIIENIRQAGFMADTNFIGSLARLSEQEWEQIKQKISNQNLLLKVKRMHEGLIVQMQNTFREDGAKKFTSPSYIKIKDKLNQLFNENEDTLYFYQDLFNADVFNAEAMPENVNPTFRLTQLSNSQTKALNKTDITMLTSEISSVISKWENMAYRDVVFIIRSDIFLQRLFSLEDFDFVAERITPLMENYTVLTTKNEQITVLKNLHITHMFERFMEGLVFVKQIEDDYKANIIPFNMSAYVRSRYVNLFKAADFIYSIVKPEIGVGHSNLADLYGNLAKLPFYKMHDVTNAFLIAAYGYGVEDSNFWRVKNTPSVSLDDMVTLKSDIQLKNVQLWDEKA